MATNLLALSIVPDSCESSDLLPIRNVADEVLRRFDAAATTDGNLPSLMISMDAERYVNMDTLNALLAEQKRVYDGLKNADRTIGKLKP